VIRSLPKIPISWERLSLPERGDCRYFDSTSVIQITDVPEPAAVKQRSLYAARIFIPQHTTATAMTMQATVRAFSKADEAIVMLSFAYPGQTLSDSLGDRQGSKT
jgi:hypothetical protein